MKTIRKYSRIVSFVYLPLLLLSFVACTPTDSRAEVVTVNETSDTDQTIMLALLLDTSNSMDGLIDQAKSQLWTIVNELSGAKCENGAAPDIKLALYEYGNDRLSMNEGYIRMVAPLTDDLDEISAKLFGLTTDGGAEYCGHVINTSLKQLNWSESTADLKMIFIAGNEGFDQGGVSFKEACGLAKEKDVVVNTIFCGGFNDGIRESWKKGADLTDGNYMSIEQDRKTVYIDTPYDDKIDALNTQLNSTYIYYGVNGNQKKQQQERQDQNASSYGKANKVKRAVSKSSGAYKSYSWDLVDATEKDSTKVLKLEEEQLPTELKGKSDEEKVLIVSEKSKERQRIKAEIQALNLQRKEYIAANMPKETENNGLDQALIKSIRTKAKTKNISFEN